MNKIYYFYYYFLNVLFFLNFSPSWHFFDLGQKIKIARSLIGPTGLLAWRLIYLEVRFKFYVTQIPWSEDTKYHYNLHFIEACKRIMWCNYLIQKNWIIYFLLQLSRYVLVWSYKKLALLNTQCMLW